MHFLFDFTRNLNFSDTIHAVCLIINLPQNFDTQIPYFNYNVIIIISQILMNSFTKSNLFEIFTEEIYSLTRYSHNMAL